jgi:outer membrane protein
MAGGEASQIIFNDNAWTRFRAAGHNLAGVEQQRETTRQNVLENACRGYVQYLQAVKNLEIESENLRLTRNNLSLARLRRQVGIAGPEEIYRWEAEEASCMASAIRAAAAAATARIQVNRGLGIDQMRLWLPREPDPGPDGHYFLDGQIGPLLKNERDIDLFERFLLKKAMRRASELAALDQQIQTLELERGLAKRRFVLPEVAAGFSYDRVLYERLLGAEGNGPEDDNEWLVTVRASLPLFEGSGRFYSLWRSGAALEAARQERESVRQAIEAAVHNVIQALGSSYPGMELQRTAAKRAVMNLDVIMEKYAGGSVSILSLLDAQRESFSAKLQAASAVYTYLDDLARMQRTIAWFEAVQTDDDKQAFVNEFREFVNQAKAEGTRHAYPQP